VLGAVFDQLCIVRKTLDHSRSACSDVSRLGRMDGACIVCDPQGWCVCLAYWRMRETPQVLQETLGQRCLDLAVDPHVCSFPKTPMLLTLAHFIMGHPERRFAFCKALLNGMITNDKFCCTRWGQLQLSWWRRPLRLRRESNHDSMSQR
jgi:hypothetical protein